MFTIRTKATSPITSSAVRRQFIQLRRAVEKCVHCLAEFCQFFRKTFKRQKVEEDRHYVDESDDCKNYCPQGRRSINFDYLGNQFRSNQV
jgi:uncharacterized protein Yka (UPF0111/DUF47 family)